MKRMGMKVTFITHSCFSVELERHILLFDYYGKGKLPDWDQNKTLYVLNSHKHADHFNLCIFDLKKRYTKIHVFLGSDIRLSENYLQRHHVELDKDIDTTHLGNHVELEYEPEFYIRTLKSTDIGVAFVIRCEDKEIYHAGDLNWWHWEGEDVSFNEAQKKNYQQEITSIADIYFDVAFVPLDGRLEQGYYLGMEYFLSKVSVDRVFPMHMWKDFSYIERYKNEKHIGAEKLADIKKDGQVFEIT